jgi:putative two-component system response regulator
MKSLQAVLPVIRSHHERWDGGGYPDGLRAHAVPLLARVLQVADIYDALTTSRPYKSAYTAPRALEILEEEARNGWRDPELVDVFCGLQRSGAPACPQVNPAGWSELDTLNRSITAENPPVN